jgi:hypothetical protein
VPVPVVQPQPRPAYQQQPPPQQQQQQQQQQMYSSASPWGAPAPAQPYSTPAAPAAADAALRWRHCFSSEPEDHDKKSVTALAYAQTLPGLPGGDGHAGWLVSAALLLGWGGGHRRSAGSTCTARQHSRRSIAIHG